MSPSGPGFTQPIITGHVSRAALQTEGRAVSGLLLCYDTNTQTGTWTRVVREEVTSYLDKSIIKRCCLVDFCVDMILITVKTNL